MADATVRDKGAFFRPLRIYWGAGDDEIVLDPEELSKLLDDENLATEERFADAFYSLCWETKFGALYPPAWWRGVNNGRYMFFDSAGQPRAAAEWKYLFKESPELRTRHLDAQWLQVCDADSCEGISCREMRAEIERLFATCRGKEDSPSPASETRRRRTIEQQAGEGEPLPKRQRKGPGPSSQEPEKATAADAGGGGLGATHRMGDANNGNEEDRSHVAAACEWSKDDMPEPETSGPPLRILVNMPDDAIRCHLSCVLQLVWYWGDRVADFALQEMEDEQIGNESEMPHPYLVLSWICDAVSPGMRLVSNEFSLQVAVEAQADREQKANTFLVTACDCLNWTGGPDALSANGFPIVRKFVVDLLVQVTRAGFPSSCAGSTCLAECIAVDARLPRLVAELFATEEVRSRYTDTFLNATGRGQLKGWLRDAAGVDECLAEESLRDNLGEEELLLKAMGDELGVDGTAHYLYFTGGDEDNIFDEAMGDELGGDGIAHYFAGGDEDNIFDEAMGDELGVDGVAHYFTGGDEDNIFDEAMGDELGVDGIAHYFTGGDEDNIFVDEED